MIDLIANLQHYATCCKCSNACTGLTIHIKTHHNFQKPSLNSISKTFIHFTTCRRMNVTGESSIMLTNDTSPQHCCI